MQNISCGNSTLNWACNHGNPKLVIEILVAAYPKAVKFSDKYGFTALHIACGCNATTRTIKYLVDKWPGALYSKNYRGMTPVHYAKHPFEGRRSNKSTIQFLVRYLQDFRNATGSSVSVRIICLE